MSADDRPSTWRVVGFAAAVCGFCSVMVSSAAVLLGPRQDANRLADRQHKVLLVAGLAEPDAPMEVEAIRDRFDASVTPRVVALPSGDYLDVAPGERAETSHEVAGNPAGVTRVPDHIVVYHVMREGAVDMVVLPIEGLGLWSTMRGYLAVDPDGTTVRGINYYEHAETPGLGSEIDNPEWQALWRGRRAFDDRGGLTLRVIKGKAGPPADDPYRVDGLTGATITSEGVNHSLTFWLGPEGFGSLLEGMRGSKEGGPS